MHNDSVTCHKHLDMGDVGSPARASDAEKRLRRKDQGRGRQQERLPGGGSWVRKAGGREAGANAEAEEWRHPAPWRHGVFLSQRLRHTGVEMSLVLGSVMAVLEAP